MNPLTFVVSQGVTNNGFENDQRHFGCNICELLVSMFVADAFFQVNFIL